MTDEKCKVLMNLWTKKEDNPTYFLDTNFKPLNKAISGYYSKGIKNGIIMELSGWESSGKTAIATQIMKAAQKQNGVAMYFDYERSFDLSLAEKQGLILDETFVYKKFPTGEDGVEACINYTKALREAKRSDGSLFFPLNTPIVAVFDSIPCMIPRSIIDKENVDNNMKDNLAIPAMLSVALPRLVQAADDYNITVIFINQLRDNVGVMYGESEKTSGGKAKNFYFTTRIKCKRTILTEKSVKIGQLVEANVIKNKQSAPFRSCSWLFKYNADGTGCFDTVGSTIDYCIENKIGGISGAGAWFEFDGQKYQGKEALKKALIADETIFAKLEAELDKLDNANENN
jgi:recombination protein RecA